MYGMPELASVLLTMARHRGCANGAHGHGLPGTRTPGGSRVPRKLRRIRHRDMAQACGEMVDRSVRATRPALERRKATAAGP